MSVHKSASRQAHTDQAIRTAQVGISEVLLENQTPVWNIISACLNTDLQQFHSPTIDNRRERKNRGVCTGLSQRPPALGLWFPVQKYNSCHNISIMGCVSVSVSVGVGVRKQEGDNKNKLIDVTLGALPGEVLSCAVTALGIPCGYKAGWPCGGFSKAGLAGAPGD
ncbi:hypothetical protein BD289DRAFT_145971 [Coniella lustricola]|uniref:Uncharacterized protein n=1 Tax=Coniella lustricola TaxID=2025994 RepID=A0A2T2ZV14_9PEZI|nr:hypothetical protein BD289DRAFT_145971 [Coniella lustricola]